MNDIKVLHITTHNEDCGIAKYQQNYIEAMAEDKNFTNTIFSYSPNKTKTMNSEELRTVMVEFENQVINYDILHIQHEFGFYFGNELNMYVDIAKKANKKVIITVHTSPDVIISQPHLGGLGPRSQYKYIREKHAANKLIRRHINPFKQADVIVAHNQLTIDSLVDFGISRENIVRIKHPVPNLVLSLDSTEIKDNLNYKKGDVIYSTVGFLHKHKGTFDAVKALKYLPKNYKLAIIGGVHPFSDSAEIYNDITDLIIKLDLMERVYITGFIKDDERLNALIQESAVCVYPYDGIYYGKTSSGALNLAFANSVPVIAYPTHTIKEIAEDSKGAAVLTDAFSYYELARKLKTTNFEEKKKQSIAYAKTMEWSRLVENIQNLYNKLS
jgi:glycosyltransferase involved in cell wall biosynthesis